MYTYKVIVVGEVAVGKTSLLHKLQTDKFAASTSTIGLSKVTFNMTLKNQEKARLDVWDTAGSEAFMSMNQLFYRDSSAALVCFKLADRSTLQGVSKWVEEVNKQLTENESMVKYLVGL